MNYEKSKEIVKLIKQSNSVLINCHKDPDPDSIGSALAMCNYLQTLDKNVSIVCPSPNLYKQISYLPSYDQIRSDVDFSTLDYSKYDLMIILDTATIDRVTGNIETKSFPVKTIVIDHHKTTIGYGDINLIDAEKTSTAEILFDLFEDWNVILTKDIANCLMAGIVGDTGAFRYPKAPARTFSVVKKLIEMGADKDKAIFQIYRSEEFNTLKFWGEVLTRMIFDVDKKYVWSAIPYEVFERYHKPKNAKETAASAFVQIVEGTDFGFVAVEEEKNNLKISFRSRTGFDTSNLAMLFGGGGHVYASGASIKNMEFEKAVEHLLTTINKNC